MFGQLKGAPGATGDVAGMAGKVLGGMAPAEAKPAAPAAPPNSAPTAKRSFGLGNIKGFRMAGPLGFEVDVARDAAQSKSDGTVGVSFTGGDWKLTRVVPNL